MARTAHTKRVALAKPVETPEQKRRKQDPLAAGVFEAIAQADDLPESCREMLAAAVPRCFQSPAAERHEHQAMLVSCIEQVINGIQAKLQANLDTLDAKTAEANCARSALEDKVSDAKAKLEEAGQAVVDRDAKLTAAQEAKQSAEVGLREAQDAQCEGDAELVEASSSKEVLDAALQDHMRPLKEAEALESHQVERHMQVLLPLAKGLALDESLLLALPAVCAQQPGRRGSFDCMVLDQLESSLKDKADKLSGELASGAPAKAERAAAVATMQSKLVEAEEAGTAAAADFTAAQAMQQEAVGAVEVAQAAVIAFDQGQSTAIAERQTKAMALQNFTSYNLECFKMLRDKATPAAA